MRVKTQVLEKDKSRVLLSVEILVRGQSFDTDRNTVADSLAVRPSQTDSLELPHCPVVSLPIPVVIH